jgi:glycosyltransferase involved in cell wall biosynthesis
VSALGHLGDLRVELHLRGEWQPGYEQQLRGLSSKVGLSASQLIGHPPAPPSQMVRLAATYDIGLALEPGTSQNSDLALSNKLFTYLLAGTPLVATATTGQRNLTETLGAAARSVPAGNPAALAAAIRSYADQSALQAARSAAWSLGERKFNWDVERVKLVSAVERVLGNRNASISKLVEVAR